jgi:quercetin dioxygenase-like cupin family protein
MSFDKGEGLTEHTSPFDAVVHIVDGKADIVIDGVSNILETGDTIIMPANIPHSLSAVEKFKMVLIMIRSKQ